jgi:hypothetical protein
MVAGNAAPDIMLKCSQCGSVDMLRNYLPVVDVKEDQEGKAPLPRLVDLASSIPYPLPVGSYLAGRSGGGADVALQINTGSDRLLSRKHFYVEVIALNGSYKTCLSRHEDAKNKTMVGDDVLSADDVIVLHDGDVIDVCGYKLRYEI